MTERYDPKRHVIVPRDIKNTTISINHADVEEFIPMSEVKPLLDALEFYSKGSYEYDFEEGSVWGPKFAQGGVMNDEGEIAYQALTNFTKNRE